MGLHNRVPELGQALLHKLHTSTQAVLLQEVMAMRAATPALMRATTAVGRDAALACSEAGALGRRGVLRAQYNQNGFVAVLAYAGAPAACLALYAG